MDPRATKTVRNNTENTQHTQYGKAHVVHYGIYVFTVLQLCRRCLPMSICLSVCLSVSNSSIVTNETSRCQHSYTI